MLHSNDFVRVRGTGSFAPDKRVTNAELVASVDTSDEWIRAQLGISERRIAADDQRTSDLAFEATKRAIADADIDPESIDLIILATATPDRLAPSSACLVKHKLGIKNDCPAFDIAAVCSGFIYSMTIGSQLLSSSSSAKRALIIGADTFSKITDWDRRDCVFFGDGAGAVILEKTEERGLFSSQIYSNTVQVDGFTVRPGEKYFEMDGRAVYNTGTRVLPRAIQDLMELNRLTASDISYVVPHQPSIKILQATAEALKIPFEKFKTNMDRYANTSGATIPLLLDEVNKSGALKKGGVLALAAVGSGWTWGAALLKW